uniref:Uncharacterized protein n=1 Tax=Bracon brevicornis TaxID=1563983 RepID=A0A6V7IKY1_9HYME
MDDISFEEIFNLDDPMSPKNNFDEVFSAAQHSPIFDDYEKATEQKIETSCIKKEPERRIYKQRELPDKLVNTLNWIKQLTEHQARSATNFQSYATIKAEPCQLAQNINGHQVQNPGYFISYATGQSPLAGSSASSWEYQNPIEQTKNNGLQSPMEYNQSFMSPSSNQEQFVPNSGNWYPPHNQSDPNYDQLQNRNHCPGCNCFQQQNWYYCDDPKFQPY